MKKSSREFTNGYVSEVTKTPLDFNEVSGSVYTYDTLGYRSVSVEVHSAGAVGSATITQGGKGVEVFPFSPAQTIAITATSTTLNTFTSDCESIKVEFSAVPPSGQLTIIVTRKR